MAKDDSSKDCFFCKLVFVDPQCPPPKKNVACNPQDLAQWQTFPRWADSHMLHFDKPLPLWLVALHLPQRAACMAFGAGEAMRLLGNCTTASRRAADSSFDQGF